MHLKVDHVWHFNDCDGKNACQVSIGDETGCILMHAIGENVKKLEKGKCITCKNLLFKKVKPENLPSLVMNDSCQVEETVDPLLMVKSINLSNNLFAKNRPPSVLLCLGSPKKHDKGKNEGDKLVKGDILNKGDPIAKPGGSRPSAE